MYYLKIDYQEWNERMDDDGLPVRVIGDGEFEHSFEEVMQEITKDLDLMKYLDVGFYKEFLEPNADDLEMTDEECLADLRDYVNYRKDEVFRGISELNWYYSENEIVQKILEDTDWNVVMLGRGTEIFYKGENNYSLVYDLWDGYNFIKVTLCDDRQQEISDTAFVYISSGENEYEVLRETIRELGYSGSIDEEHLTIVGEAGHLYNLPR